MTKSDPADPGPRETWWVCAIPGCGRFATRVHMGWLCGEHAREYREHLRAQERRRGRSR